ncbi:putative DEAD-box ATP-dependent RNA helicase [Stieleria bergensis]|uniref:Putative DEAD-box ATP-dependent RNA helicase n=1 Tax=Stieleria bergensis TaxID=2528025 RepID=A0A517T249_9BACT|nr:putative DEAD-box ATP-dependent RNA helicase [Planctomycetes bacterium SV_7m_r]
MSNFQYLHPAIQHHIVNALGWRDLRPFQDDLIPSIVQGEHHIILAPTAGGKTEAALFPLLTRMANEDWSGLSVLYICPLRALLNNLHERVEQYSGFIGREAGVWHGDTKVSKKNEMLRNPPSVMLTTPESLEGILISPNKDHRAFLSGVQAIVIDEIHSFAGDDRGWHLLFVMNRIREVAGREMQRLGLSATVGNPEDLMKWLTVGCAGTQRIYLPEPAKALGNADVTLDYVGSIDNAATVISRLHRGQKRLVFIDSRSKAEQLGNELRELDVDAFVTHGSLSREQRLLSEKAFAERSNCVIVATGVLELGIDIGSLDKVIQIEAPNDVAGFLQRMGRTGRRAGTTRNYLFLATKLPSMARAAALIELWRSGYVEPALAPASPLHIAAQQMLALSLQCNGSPATDLIHHSEEIISYSGIEEGKMSDLLNWMIEEEIVFSDQGVISMGRAGDDEYGRRNFIDLVSVFCTPPLFTIRHGRQDVGYVDPMTFAQKREPPWYILLAGRSWKVNHIDWRRKVAFVEPAQASGRSRWYGLGPHLGYELCQSYKAILTQDFRRDWWSQRVVDQMLEMRMDHAWLKQDGSTLTLGDENRVEWWTFGGTQGNATLSAALNQQMGVDIKSDGLKISIDLSKSLTEVEEAIKALKNTNFNVVRPAISDRAIDGLKFSKCLPHDMATQVLEDRLRNAKVAKRIAAQPVSVVTGHS